MKNNREINQQVLNTAVDKKGRPTINLDKRKSIYESVTEALRAIPVTNRNVGLTIPIYNGVKVVEYWWEKGIKDSDFVKKIDSENIPRINSTLTSLQNQIDSISSFEFKVVISLPTKGKSGIIYVVPAAEPTSTNIYDEYFWIESAQSYERWGGVDPEGDVVINNAFTFNENHFNVTEEYGIQNVSLKCDILDVTDKGFDIYKLAVGEDNNEKLISISKYNRTIIGASAYGGNLSLYGKSNIINQGTTEYNLTIRYDNIKLNSDDGTNEYELNIQSNKLKIDDGTDNIEITNNTLKFNKNGDTKINLTGTGFNVDINVINLRAAQSSDIFANRSLISMTDAYIKMYGTKISTENLYFMQNGTDDIYLDGYNAKVSNTTYHGLRSSSDIYLNGTDKAYRIQGNSGYLTSYGANSIKCKTSGQGFGANVMQWSDDTVIIGNTYKLHIDPFIVLLGKENGTVFSIDRTNNDILLQQIATDDEQRYISFRNNDKFIRIKNNSTRIELYEDLIECYSPGFVLGVNHSGIEILDDIDSDHPEDSVIKTTITSGNTSNPGYVKLEAGLSYLKVDGRSDWRDIKMYAPDGIEIKGWNNGRFLIDSDGWCFIEGNACSKIGLTGINNGNSYFIIEEGDYALPDMRIQQNVNNYISLFKNNSSENHIVIRSEYFDFRNGSNNTFISINGDGDYNFTVNDYFKWSFENNAYFQITPIGIVYNDGTDTYTKTWAQIFS